MRMKNDFHIRLSTYPRFETEAGGNSEMAYLNSFTLEFYAL